MESLCLLGGFLFFPFVKHRREDRDGGVVMAEERRRAREQFWTKEQMNVFHRRIWIFSVRFLVVGSLCVLMEGVKVSHERLKNPSTRDKMLP